MGFWAHTASDSPDVRGDQQAVSRALQGAHPSSTIEMCAMTVLLLDGFKNTLEELRPIAFPQILKNFKAFSVVLSKG